MTDLAMNTWDAAEFSCFHSFSESNSTSLLTKQSSCRSEIRLEYIFSCKYILIPYLVESCSTYTTHCKIQSVLTLYFHHPWTSVFPQCCQKQQSHLSSVNPLPLLLSLAHVKGKQKLDLCLKFSFKTTFLTLQPTAKPQEQLYQQHGKQQRAGEIPLELLWVYSYLDIHHTWKLKRHYWPLKHPVLELFTAPHSSPD